MNCFIRGVVLITKGHKPDQVICDVCGHRYISENDLNVHMQSLHSGYNNLSSIISSSCKINPESANKNVDNLEDNCDLIVLTEPSHAGIQASPRHSFVFRSSAHVTYCIIVSGVFCTICLPVWRTFSVKAISNQLYFPV